MVQKSPDDAEGRRDVTRLVILSDTHGKHGELSVPDGDVLIHAGDMSRLGELVEIEEFDRFLAGLPHRHKIVVAGNHDFGFERTPRQARAALAHATYLEDEALEVEGLRFYGSPWQPEFCGWAFNLPRGEPLRRIWARIPEDTDVLVTHGPPRGVLDELHRGGRAGCEELAARLAVVRPALHCFGHIHEAAGTCRREGTLFVNACSCDLGYRARNPPVVVDFEAGVASLVRTPPRGT